MNSRDKDKGSGQFVNDLLRTEFHKYVRSTYFIEKHPALTLATTESSWPNSLRYAFCAPIPCRRTHTLLLFQ